MTSIRKILAVSLFTILMTSLAGCASSPLLEGNDAFVQGDFQAAEAQWRPLAEAGNVDAQHNLGVLDHRLGNDDQARNWWRSAVAQEFVPSMLALASLEMSSGRPAEAIALYRRAARWADPNAVAALEALDQPVPHADLWLAEEEQARQRQRLAAQRFDHRIQGLDSNEWWTPWNRVDG